MQNPDTKPATAPGLRYRVSLYARNASGHHLETFSVLDAGFLGRWVDLALRNWEAAGQPAHAIVVPEGPAHRRGGICDICEGHCIARAWRVRYTTPCVGSPTGARHVWKWEGLALDQAEAAATALIVMATPGLNRDFDRAQAVLLDAVQLAGADADRWLYPWHPDNFDQDAA